MIAPGAMVLFQSQLKLVAQFLECSFCPVDSGECDEVFSAAEHTRFYSDVAFVIFEEFVLRGLTNVIRCLLDFDGDLAHAPEHFGLFRFFSWHGHERSPGKAVIVSRTKTFLLLGSIWRYGGNPQELSSGAEAQFEPRSLCGSPSRLRMN